MKTVYITHCSAKKDDSFKCTGIKTTPDILYTATYLQRFIRQCQKKGQMWAIFSDLYGVVFSEVEICWYNKDPDDVTEDEYQELLSGFQDTLAGYGEIWFYYNPGRIHPLYQRLINDARNRGLNVIRFTHLADIG